MDLVNCSNCDGIFDFNLEGTQCDGCDDVFCRACIDQKAVSCFRFNNRPKCTNCFITEPPTVLTFSLFDYMLNKYNVSEKQIREEYIQTNPLFYTTPQNTYVCTKCKVHQCASRLCERVSQDYTGPRNAIVSRGFCCKAQDEWDCDACLKWEAQRICVTLVGIRKFRKDSSLRCVPRDVLIHCILKPFILPPFRGEDERTTKKLKI